RKRLDYGPRQSGMPCCSLINDCRMSPHKKTYLNSLPPLGSFFVLIVYYQCVMRMVLSIFIHPAKMLMSLQVYEGNGVILIHLSLEPQMNQGHVAFALRKI